MRFYWLLLAVLSAWRITHLLAAEDGPWDVMARLRRRAGSGSLGRLLDCFYCLSLWVCAPIALLLGDDWAERALLWLALSAGAVLLERVTQPFAVAPAEHSEDNKESNDVVLRQSTEADQGHDPDSKRG